MRFHKNKEPIEKGKPQLFNALGRLFVKVWHIISAPFRMIGKGFKNLFKRSKRAYKAFLAKESDATKNEIEERIIALITEMYRFNGTFERMLTKIPEDDVLKYSSKYQWFSKRVFEMAETIDVQIVDLSGKDYDPGLPVTAFNLEDYKENDLLIISQMLEPIVMRQGTVLKAGTVIIDKKNNTGNGNSDQQGR